MPAYFAKKPEAAAPAKRKWTSIPEKTFEEKKLAAKKLRSQSGKPPKKKRGSWLKAAGNRERKRQRKASEFARTFHSQERVLWVKSLACVATGQFATERDPIDNAHVCDDGSKGTSRRSGYACIAPLKRSAHRLLHANPRKFREKFGHFNWSAMAAYTDAQWEKFAGVGGGRLPE